MAHDHFYGICENKCLVEIKAENIPGAVGRSLAGQTVSPTEGTTVTAGTGAEIFNDYSENVASGKYSHAEGHSTTASSQAAHAEGQSTTASSQAAHAEGLVTTASGTGSHAEGQYTTASGNSAHAEGYSTTASGNISHAGGHSTIANAYQTTLGRFNISSAGPTSLSSTSGDIFIIGNGSSDSKRSNAFRVTTAGAVYGKAAYNSSGADYAEMWEIEGGNHNEDDWRGLFVTVNENNKIAIANPDDYILGIISATPSVLGDVQSEIWHKMYLKDVFGEHLTETVEVEETTDEFGDVTPAHTETRWILNPEYDSSKEYISRDKRPEWAAVGLIGKLVVVDDGTCTPGQFCKVADGGIATASGNNEGYRVLERCDKNHVRIMFR